MKKSEIIVVHNLNIEQLDQGFIKIGQDFKEYKKEWVLDVRKKENTFIVNAFNRNRVILMDGRGKDEVAKSMKILVIEDLDKLVLEKKYSYSLHHLILIQVIPWLIYTADFMFVTTLVIFSFLGKDTKNLLGYVIMFVALTATEIYCTWGAKKLEKDRLRIIEELLQRFIYDDKSM